MTRTAKILLSLFTALLAMGVTACSHGTSSPSRSSAKFAAPAIEQPALACTKGKAYMGCAAPPPAFAPKLSFGAAPGGHYFVDVSSWQGHPNWTVAKPHIAGAVDKLGEYVVDPTVAYNVGQQRRLGIPFGVYWFVRPIGCTSVADRMVAALRTLGTITGPIVADIEVPGLSGYAACIDGVVFRALHRHIAVYTAPGTWSGGSAAGRLLWLASYGPSSPPTLNGLRASAWQFTDGRWGFPVYVPGVGQGDVSVDYNLFKLAGPPSPPTACPAHVKAINRQCLKLFLDQTVTSRAVNERAVATRYKYGKRTGALHDDLVLLRQRVWYVAHHHRVRGQWISNRADWRFHRGYRYQRLARDAANK